MSDHTAFTGSVPQHYDTGLGPTIFEPFAVELAARVAARAPGIVLEMAAGTGIVTRHLRNSLPAHAELIATDLNDAMLDVAKTKFEPDELVGFEVADACALPFTDARFDLIACQFGIMFFPDLVQSFREALRVLKPGGTYILTTWGSMAENPFSLLAQQTAEEFFPDDPPGFYPIPFSMPDPAPVCDELRDAGFTTATAERISIQANIEGIDDLARGTVYGNPFVEEVRERGINPDELKAVMADLLRSNFGDPGAMPLTINLIIAEKA